MNYTVDKRWINLEQSWDDRIKLMSTYIKPNSSVIDIGSGLEVLYKHLPNGCAYTPCDVVKRTERTIVCNINENIYPDVKERDYIFLSGVLEYLKNLETFFSRISQYGNKIILSYNSIDINRNQRDPTWVNAHTSREIIKMLKRNGYFIIDKQKCYNPPQIIIYAERIEGKWGWFRAWMKRYGITTRQ